MNTPYRVRVHPRARHVRLRLDPQEGLLVTVPPGFNQRRIPGLLAERRQWIEQTRQALATRRSDLDPAIHGPRPERISLPAINETWTVRYASSGSRKTELIQAGATLTVDVPGNPDESDDRTIAARLQRWLKQRANQVLVPMVDELATAHGIRYGRITIRNQRSRWGSCSSRGDLSLNAKLLLCSPAACRYVLVHELTHVEHPNHSRAFWARVAQLEPEYRAAMHELKAVWQRLPRWV